MLKIMISTFTHGRSFGKSPSLDFVHTFQNFCICKKNLEKIKAPYEKLIHQVVVLKHFNEHRNKKT